MTENDKQYYDWYIKTRPDFKLLEPINFHILSNISINARVRVYRGPKRVKYGMSVNGEGDHKHIGDCYYDDYEKTVIMDDCVYIFSNKVVKMGAFNPINSDGLENEWFHTAVWNSRSIPLNLIGINAICLKYDLTAGSVNM